MTREALAGLSYFAIVAMVAVGVLGTIEHHDAMRAAAFEHRMTAAYARQLEARSDPRSEHGDAWRRCDVAGPTIRCHEVQP